MMITIDIDPQDKIMNQAFVRTLLLAMTCVVGATAAAASLQGTAMYRERIAAPADAIFEARLQQVLADGTPGQVVGRAALNPAGQTPFRFEIVYDDSAVKPGLHYRVSTVLMRQDQALFTGIAPVTLPHTESKPVMIMMQKGAQPAAIASSASTASSSSSSASSSASPDAPPSASASASASATDSASTGKPDTPLRNTYWKLVTLHGKPVQAHDQQREAHIVFSSNDNRLSGSSGCNRMMGGFENKNGQLKIKDVAGTMMACPQGMEVETQFVKALLTVTRYNISGEHMDMLDANGDIVAGFEAVALQ